RNTRVTLNRIQWVTFAGLHGSVWQEFPTCPVRHECTTAKVNGKVIQRSEFKENIQHNAKRVHANQELYKKRQALVEHPFGTIKRQWGFDYIMTKKGMPSASADFGLIAIAYNLRRLFNLKIDIKGLVIGIKLVYMTLKTNLAVILSYFNPRKQLLLYTLPISKFQAIFNE
ncbi:transposase, partial [Galbibacter orientalis]|uniref:transposase n=1 Tax=Galbibacter orientalis TaxID=453852 RepID=UPI003080A176